MTVQAGVHDEFLARLAAVPTHGLGLSIDIHAPDLASLRRSLQERLIPFGYLEVFRAPTLALEGVKRDVGDGLLAYHGEGLWVTQPEMAETEDFRQAFSETVEHLRVLQSAWLNHECATKVLAGHCFGTYLPPLYTRSSAALVSDNIRQIQFLLDQQCRLAHGGAPLVLLEMPPLTYFVAGTLALPSFFRLVCEQSSCGLVLDVGHLWTVFRYSTACRTWPLERFVKDFLDKFPVERVVEIHLAGLDVHCSIGSEVVIPPARTSQAVLPAWIDAHAAPIPPILFEMLDQILSHPRLINVKGLALEVDTKPIELIVEEFTEFSQRYNSVFPRTSRTDDIAFGLDASSVSEEQCSTRTKECLKDAYDHYVLVLTGQTEPVGPNWEHPVAYGEEVDRYRAGYLPHEILHWGGDLEDMFIETCRRLKERGLLLEAFVAFWFREPRPSVGSYDFFLLKIERFVEFVREVTPDLQHMVEREARELRQAYRLVNQPTLPVEIA